MRRLFPVIIAFSLLLFGCKEDKKVPVKTVKIEFKKEGDLSVFKSDSVVASFSIEIAEDDYEQQRGLMDRKSMADDQAMLFIFPNSDYRSFYMKSTYIPLDIIYINSAKKIVSFQKNAKPLDEKSLPSNALAQYVLEINAGLSDRYNLAVGDSIDFSRQ